MPKFILTPGLISFFSSKSANEQLFDMMRKATAQAEANGLTTEVLEELLKEND